jgi:iron complex outermembrane receptor protein
MARYVSELPNPEAPSYTAVDSRYGWQMTDNLELSLSLQNMFDTGHTEFGDPATASEYERSTFVKLTWMN